MKKSDINSILKEAGLQFVKISTGTGWDSKDKCYTGFNGKRVKGIPTASYGPMTATNVHNEKTASVKSEVISKLKKLGMVEQDDILVSEDGKIKFSLTEQWFPKYTRSAGYDESYQNIYLVPNFQ